MNEYIFFTSWVGFHLGRPQGLVKCDLRAHGRKIVLLQAWYKLIPLCLENVVAKNLHILLVLMSLNNSVLKFQTV